MAAWVRGVRASGPADLSFDDFGLPATIRQDGWAVEYRGWSAREPALPTKVFARQGHASVKLVVEKWESPVTGLPAGEWTVWPAPAKLNLFLRILGRRADGYHLLQTVFQLLDWGDSIRLRLRDDGTDCSRRRRHRAHSRIR